VDLDPDDIRLPDGTRLTQEVAEAIVEDVRRRAGRPSLTGQSEVPPGVSFRLTPDVREQGPPRSPNAKARRSVRHASFDLIRRFDTSETLQPSKYGSSSGAPGRIRNCPIPISAVPVFVGLGASVPRKYWPVRVLRYAH
jgi:hypothetical protein